MTAADSFWLIPVLPLLVVAALVLGLGRSRRWSTWLAVAGVAGATLLSILSLLAVLGGARSLVALPWLTIGGREIHLMLWLDPLSALAATLVSTISLVVFIYAAFYMADDPHPGRFFAEMSLFAGSMLVLVLSADLLLLFLAWELVGLCSYLLIGFWFERRGVPEAASKAFLTTRSADLALLAGVLLLFGAIGTSSITDVLSAVERGRLPADHLFLIALLLFIGAAGKSAQVPFQGWLPDAMAGPTPVSALLHSATMVAAGVFLVARLYPLFLATTPALSVVAWVGVITALVGAAAALVQSDLKRTLAYSTMSQIGLMFVGLGSGSLLAGVLLLVAQAVYKATLFLAAGAVDHAVEGTGYERMGGLARRMPLTFLAFALSAAALAGLPVTLALPPKDPVLAAAWEINGALFAVALLASLLTALYSARMVGLVFLGGPSEPAREAHEADPGLRVPLLVLAGSLPLVLLADAALLGHPLSRFFAAQHPESWPATVLALAVAVAGTASGLWAIRRWPGAHIWPPLRWLRPLFAGEFGLVAAYRALARGGLLLTRALGRFDRRSFDPLAAHLAHIAYAGIQRTGATDRRVFDPVGRRLASVARATVARLGLADRRLFDATADRIAAETLAAVRMSGRFDLQRVDAAILAAARALLSAGQRLRRLQTGRIDNYLLALFLWLVGAAALALIVVLAR